MKFQTPYNNPYATIDPNSNAHDDNTVSQGYEMGYYNNADSNYQSGAGYGHDDMIQFFSDLEDIKKDLKTYDATVDRIEQLHTRSLSEVNDQAVEIVNDQLTDAVSDARAQSSNLRYKVQQLLNHSVNDNTKTTQAENIKVEFQKSVKRYQSVENTFRKRFRDRTERQFRTVRPDASDAEIKEVVDQAESGQTQIFAQAVMQSNRVGAAQSALDEIQNRHNEILLINKTVEELAELFRDLELMVAEQGETVTNIQNNAEVTSRHLENGLVQVQGGINKAKSFRKKKWICLGIVILIIIIIVVVVVVYKVTQK